jgi:fermentation-respiration switch protein FrsA (DUF1100 family)
MATKKASKPQSKFWKWTKRILLTLISFALLFIFVVVPVLLAYFVTHAGTGPLDTRDKDTPATLNVPYEDIRFKSFNSLDELDRAASVRIENDSANHSPIISGWYLPHDSAKAIIIYVHGLFRSKKQMIKRASEFWKQGYAGLAIDLRRHGESTGKLTGVGFLERLDVLAATRFIREELKLELPVVASGVSLGAVEVLLAAAESQEIDAVIAESSFLSFENTVVHHVNLYFNFPRFPFADVLMLFTKFWGGFSNDDLDMRIAVRKIGNRPILFLADERDHRMTVEVMEELYEAAISSQKHLAIIPDATHGKAYPTNPELYVETIVAFLQKHLD